jgi:hypothetical protein
LAWKSRLGREPNLECGRLVLADRGHLHIGAQRLPERRLHIQAAQTGSMRASGRETQSYGDGKRGASARCSKFVRRHGCPLNIGIQDFRK